MKKTIVLTNIVLFSFNSTATYRMASNTRNRTGPQGNHCFDCTTAESINNALFAAAGAGHDVRIDELVKAGADVNAENHRGSTPLHEAALKGHDRCVKTLIKLGSDVNLSSWLGTALALTAQEGHYKCIESLLQAGADINIRYYFRNQTVLMLAALSGSLKCIKLLIQAGAGVNDVDQEGNTVLHILLQTHFDKFGERAKCFRFLIAAGANVNITNNKGKTAVPDFLAWSGRQQQQHGHYL